MLYTLWNTLTKSIVIRITTLLISVFLMAFISIFSSIYMSQVSEYDGKAINLSGSLRMMSYRITSQVVAVQQNDSAANRAKVKRLIDHFEQTFQDPVLKRDFKRFGDHSLVGDYDKVHQDWYQTIKPTLTHADQHFDLNQFLPILEAFVNDVDTLVYGYQSLLEHKLAQLKWIQFATLSSTFVLIVLSILTIHRYIARPLKNLTTVAEASSRGDWSLRCNLKSRDELGLLADTLNKANQSIQTIHDDQEKTIQLKTEALRQNNEILTFLYQIAQQVSDSHQNQLDYPKILNELRAVSQTDFLELHLTSEDSDEAYLQVSSTQVGGLEKAQIKRFTISRDEHHYGHIVVYHRQGLDLWQNNLIFAICDQFAMAFHLSDNLNQQRRIALLRERSIIARELHDSLAQSLSYLKIQVTRIEKVMTTLAPTPQLTDPVRELKEGLISAYQQLRQLLTTFRLQIDEHGLEQALKNTINLMRQRHEFDIDYDYRCRHIPLEPYEEIHLLQIAKEALQNAISHSGGDHIVIQLNQIEQHDIQLLIQDNGSGLTNREQKLNHYGTEIMQERCRSLKGKLVRQNRPCGGTEVILTFKPAYLKEKLDA